MIRVDKLRGIIAEKGFTQQEVAKMIGISPKTFYDKMKKGIFGSDEMQIMIDRLEINDPAAIFFAKE